MPGSFTDEGIVLRRVNYGEADRILTVLTRGHGKVGVIARGVRKAGSRMAAQTDLFERSRMQLAEGRGELLVLTQAQRASGPPAGLATDARRSGCAAVVAELTDRVLEGHHPDGAVFGLVAESLDELGDPERDPRRALVQCVSCSRRLAEEPAAFSAAGGGLLCPDCRRGDPTAIDCPVRVIKVLRVAAAGDATTWARLRLDHDALATLEAIIERELEQHLDRRLRSWEVLRALER
jgi:DNA repair protein RecO (recombination protein O)